MKEGGTGDGRWNTKDEDEQRREKSTLNNEIKYPQNRIKPPDKNKNQNKPKNEEKIKIKKEKRK